MLSPQHFTQQPCEVAILILKYLILQIQKLRPLCKLSIETGGNKYQQSSNTDSQIIPESLVLSTIIPLITADALLCMP